MLSFGYSDFQFSWGGVCHLTNIPVFYIDER
jgi:hypothetical protein